MGTGFGVTTADQLLGHRRSGGRYELVEGVLRQMTPAGHVHGRVAANVLTMLTSHVRERRLGVTYAAETGFLLRRSPDTVRAPDASFVTAARLAAIDLSSRGYFPGAPDLVVEVISPEDRSIEVDEKTADWLASGCQVVVVLDPQREIAVVHRRNLPSETLRVEDHLTVPDLLPGWAVTVGELFR